MCLLWTSVTSVLPSIYKRVNSIFYLTIVYLRHFFIHLVRQNQKYTIYKLLNMVLPNIKIHHIQNQEYTTYKIVRIDRHGRSNWCVKICKDRRTSSMIVSSLFFTICSIIRHCPRDLAPQSSPPPFPTDVHRKKRVKKF